MEAADQEQAALAVHWQSSFATGCLSSGPVQAGALTREGSLLATPAKLSDRPFASLVFSPPASESAALPPQLDVAEQPASVPRPLPADRWESLFPDQRKPFRVQWGHVKELLSADGLAVPVREKKASGDCLDDWFAALDNRFYEHRRQLERLLANARNTSHPQNGMVEELTAVRDRQSQSGTVGELMVSVEKIQAEFEAQQAALRVQSRAVEDLTAAMDRQRNEWEDRFLADKAQHESQRADVVAFRNLVEDRLQNMPDTATISVGAELAELAVTVDRHRAQVEEHLAGARATHSAHRADLNAVRDLVEERLIRDIAALQQAVDGGRAASTDSFSDRDCGSLPEVLRDWQTIIEARVGGERAAADEGRRRHVAQVKAELEGRLADVAMSLSASSEAAETREVETRTLRADLIEMRTQFDTFRSVGGPEVDPPGHTEFDSLRAAIHEIQANVEGRLAVVQAEVADSVSELARCITSSRAETDDADRADHAHLHDQLRLELEALREGLASSATHDHTFESDHNEQLQLEMAELIRSHQRLHMEVDVTRAEAESSHHKFAGLQEEMSAQHDAHEHFLVSMRATVEERSDVLRESHERGLAVFYASTEEREAEMRCSICELQENLHQAQATAVAERTSVAELRPALETELRGVLEFCFTELRGTLEGQLAGVEDRFRKVVSAMAQEQQSTSRASIRDVDDRLRAELARLWKAQEIRGVVKVADQHVRTPSVCESDTTCGGNNSPRDHRVDAQRTPDGLRSAPHFSRPSVKSCIRASGGPKSVTVRRAVSAPGPYGVSRILSPQLSPQVSSVSPRLDTSPRVTPRPVWPPASPSAHAY